MVQSIYDAKLTGTDEAIAEVSDRSNLVISMGASMPPGLMAAVGRRVKDGSLTRLDVYYMLTSLYGAEALLNPEMMDVIKPHPLFMSLMDRDLAEKGNALGKEWVDFVPCTFHQAGRLLTQNISPDCFILTVSPMDKSGYFSLGTNADYGATVVRKAKRVIVEVNKHMPRTFGECLLHVSNVDAIVEHDHPLQELPESVADPEDDVIARAIAERIPDGATLQMGVGSIPNIVMGDLKGHKDLGLHTELFTPPMAQLIRSGVINGSRKSVMPWKHVFALAIGDTEMYEFMNDNPSMVGYPVSWVNNPAVIRKNDTMVSVNAAIEVDLTGQVNSEALNGFTWSGTGGQLDFVRGAYAAENGRSFIALHSTAKGGTISRIVPQLTTVTDPRMDTHVIVTEHGVVDLKGRSLSERAAMIISLAAPEFRDGLEQKAKEMRLI